MRFAWATIRLIFVILVITFSTTAPANNNACHSPSSESVYNDAVHNHPTSCDEHCLNVDATTHCSMMSACPPCLSPVSTLVVTAPFVFDRSLSIERPNIWVSLIVMPELQPPRNQLI